MLPQSRLLAAQTILSAIGARCEVAPGLSRSE